MFRVFLQKALDESKLPKATPIFLSTSHVMFSTKFSKSIARQYSFAGILIYWKNSIQFRTNELLETILSMIFYKIDRRLIGLRSDNSLGLGIFGMGTIEAIFQFYGNQPLSGQQFTIYYIAILQVKEDLSFVE